MAFISLLRISVFTLFWAFTLISWNMVLMATLKAMIISIPEASWVWELLRFFLILCMSSNFGLYPGHCKYYVMNLLFLLNSSREFFCFSRVSVGGYGSNICLVSKASVVLIWSLHMHTTQQPVWDSGGGLYCSSVLKAFAVCLWFNYTHVQLWGEPRNWSTDLKDPFF